MSALPRHLVAPRTSLWFNLEVSARRYPDKAAVVYLDEALSFSALARQCEALAAWLQHVAGVKRGDRVLLCMQNCPQWIVACYAALRADAVVVPINPMNLAQELRHYVHDAEPVLAVCAAELAPRLREASDTLPLLVTHYADALVQVPADAPAWLTERHALPTGAVAWTEALAETRAPHPHTAGPDDLALLPYTSGTTGLPKGCRHPHRTVMHNVVAAAIWSGAHSERVSLSTLPLYHVAGMLAGMHSPIYVGATCVLLPRWDRDAAARLIPQYRVSYWSCISTMLIDFLDNPALDPAALESLDFIGGGGAPMPAAVAERLRDRFGLTYGEGYGLTETMGATHRNPREKPKLQCLGIPFIGTDAGIVDPDTGEALPQGQTGEIVVHGPQVFEGYWRNEAATRECFMTLDGKPFFRTGDLGHVDEEGYFFLTDRLKRMINASGYKVWPAEVEAALHRHPAVREACVVRAKDAYRGETVKAYVVRSALHHEPVDEQQLIAWARTQLAAYKCPRLIEFVDTLPKSSAGKLMWRELQEREDQRAG